jgi:hypothetical protein
MSAGLGQSVLASQSSPGQAQAVIDYNLDRLFPASRPALCRALVKVPATGLLRGPCLDGSMFGEQAPDSLLAGRRLHRVIKRSPAQLPQARRTRGRCARPAPDRYGRPRRCPHLRDLGNGDAPALSARASSPPAGSDPPGIRGRVSCGHGRCPSRGRPRLGRHRRGGAAPRRPCCGLPCAAARGRRGSRKQGSNPSPGRSLPGQQHPDLSGQGQVTGRRCKSRARLASGGGPLSVRVRPFSLKRDCLRRVLVQILVWCRPVAGE